MRSKILNILQQETDPDVKQSEVGDDVKLSDHSTPLRRSKRAANTITTPYGLGGQTWFFPPEHTWNNNSDISKIKIT